MIPTTFISVATLFFLIGPSNNSKRNFAPKESEVKTNVSLSINLHLNSSNETGKNSEGTPDVKPGKSTLELPPESFIENSILLEPWMSSPQTWNNNSDK